MKLEYLKEKKELLSVALLGLSGLMAVLILLKVTSFVTAPARAQEVVQTALENTNTESLNVEQHFTKDRNIADTLTRNNLFSEPASAEHPVKEVRSILGDQVFINNNWYSEGQTIPGNVKVVAIEPTQVVIEWEGKPTTFRPIDASIPEPERSGRETARTGSTERTVAAMTTVGTQTTQTQRGGMGIDLQNIRSTFQNMSQAERERLRGEMIQRFGGRGAGGFSGGRDSGGRGGGGRGGGGGGRGGGGRGGR